MKFDKGDKVTIYKIPLGIGGWVLAEMLNMVI